MTVSSAPGKAYLFGEHAVVYGEPAVPCAIERRAVVEVSPRQDNRVRVEAADLTLAGFTVEYRASTDAKPDVAVPERLVSAAMGYVDEAVNQARDATDSPEAGFDIRIESEIPLGGGLGSSAAVTVAAIDAATRSLGVSLGQEEIAERAFEAEYAVQDGQASRADTYCSAMGGAVRVEGTDCRPLDAPDLPLVVGFDGGAGETGRLVAGVRALRDQYPFAAETIEAIGNLVREGEDALVRGDLESLGELMNFNHGLLSALGVSSPSLDQMAWAARKGGAHGAKLTGAGGGGCVVAIDESGDALTALSTTSVCEDAFTAQLSAEGVREEIHP